MDINTRKVVASMCRKLLCVFLITTAGISASCSNVASVLNLDADLELNIMAKADINPDDSDTASPVVIRLYELKDRKKFEEIEFYDLYVNDKKVLGKNLIDKHRLKHLVPDSKRTKQLVLNKKTKFIGFFAEFSQYKKSKFRAVVEIDPHFDRKVDVILSGTDLLVDYKKNNLLIDLDIHENDEDMEKMKSAADKLSGA